jgi:hypothetical protein
VQAGFTHPGKEARIRSFGVGLLAIATLAVASFVLRRRRLSMALVPDRGKLGVDELYAAGL